MEKVGTLRWDGAVAQARMDNILSAFYGKDRVDAVLSPYDGLSIGILSSLKGVGYGTPKQPMPDRERPGRRDSLDQVDHQGRAVFDSVQGHRELAKVTVNMVEAVMSGKKPEVNDTKTYNNGVKVVPSYLLKPVPVDKTNWKKIVVDSGYYTEDKLK
jgi:putative multiple sugar transport system substrate-binding protein